MKNTILILGANILQIPLINKANELGFETLVVSPNMSEPGHKLSKYSEICDVIDEEGVLAIAKKYDIDFALKRDATTFPPTYHVFFRTSQTENFNRAFKEYATGKSQEISKKPYDRQKLQEKAQEIANQPRERKEKVLVRSKESSL